MPCERTGSEARGAITDAEPNTEEYVKLLGGRRAAVTESHAPKRAPLPGHGPRQEVAGKRSNDIAVGGALGESSNEIDR